MAERDDRLGGGEAPCGRVPLRLGPDAAAARRRENGNAGGNRIEAASPRRMPRGLENRHAMMECRRGGRLDDRRARIAPWVVRMAGWVMVGSGMAAEGRSRRRLEAAGIGKAPRPCWMPRRIEQA